MDFFLLLALMASLLLFGVVVHEVLGEKEDSFDFSVFRYLTAHVVAPRLTAIMEAITFFASRNFLLVAYLLLIAFYFYKKQRQQALEILLVGSIGFLINYAMKLAYHRPRPGNPLVYHLEN